MAVITRSMSKRKRKRKRKEDADVETNKTRIEDLNDTLLELIFARLSLWRYLATSKCVSKRWNSIISNPDFTRQLNPQSFPFTLLLSHDKCPVTEHPYFQKHKFHLDFLPTPHSKVANTNDLIVLHHRINSLERVFYVANPLTKQYVVVPVTFAQPFGPYSNMFGIAGFVNGVSTVNISHCDNYNNNHGFRIVQVMSGMSKLKVLIYSSETGQWKSYSFDCVVDWPHWRDDIYPITLNNTIHWINGSKIIVIDPFNIDNVPPRVVNLPVGIGNRTSTFGICQNRLRIAQFEEKRSDRENQRIQIWEIDDYDNVVDDLGTNYLAKLKLVIDLELKRSIRNCIFPGIGRYYRPSKYHKMVCCHPNDPQVVYLYCDGRLFYCNVVEKKSKEIEVCCLSTNVFVFIHPP